MKTFKSGLIVIIILAVLSCNKNRIYEEHNSEFPNYRWEKNNSVEFSPDISEINPEYKIYVALRHIYGFQLKNVEINLEMIFPSGKSSNKNYSLQVFNDQSELLSDCQGDYCDLEVLIEDNYKFEEPGKYRFIITQVMDIPAIPNVMEVGLIIEKSVSAV